MPAALTPRRRWTAALSALVALLGLAGWLAGLAAPALAKDVPFLSGRVVDEAGMLSPAARQRIDAELAALEQRTGAQIAVLIVPNLGGEPLEDYSVRVAQTWKLGQKGKDNGLLLLISRDDRKMRIEVGYGLEPKLTDLESHQILDDVIRPRFRQGDFDGGVEQGVEAIGKLLSGEPLPPRPAVNDGNLPTAQKLPFLGIFLVVIGIFSAVALGTRGCGGWFLYAFLSPFYYAFTTVFAGATVALVVTLCWLVAFPILKVLLGRHGGFMSRLGGGGFWGGFGGGGWGGGWTGGGGGGFSSGGGGFSGGGGSFGGGGASSGW